MKLLKHRKLGIALMCLLLTFSLLLTVRVRRPQGMTP